MKTLYQPSFIKDLKALKSTSVFQQINKLVFQDIPKYQTIANNTMEKMYGDTILK